MLESCPFTTIADVNPSVAKIPPPGSLVSFIPMGDVSETGEWFNRQTREVCSVSKGYTVFQEGDVLFAKITPCMENGKGCHVIGLRNGVGFGSTEFIVLRAKGNTSSRYLFHWTRYNELRRKAELSMSGSAGQQRVQPSFFSRFMIPDICGSEQTAIAKVLDTVDNSIRQTAAVIEKLKRIKAGLLHDLLTRGIDESGQLRDPIRHPEQFKDSPLGKVPKEWDVSRFSSSVSHSAFGPRFGAGLYSPSGDVALIRTTDLDNEGNFVASELPRVAISAASMNAHLLNKGDLLITRSGTVGVATVFQGHRLPVIAGAFLIRFQLTSKLRAYYARAYFNWCEGRKRLLDASSGGVLKNITGTSILRLPFAFPLPDEQMRIESVLMAHDDRIRTEEATLCKLTMMKQGLMQDLLYGRVRVPADIAAEHERKTVAAAKEKKGHEANIYFKRSVLAAEIVSLMHKSPTFGHVKFMKTLYLVEQLAHVALKGHYHRAAAGPLDNHMIRSVDGQMERQKWFRKVPRNQGVAGKPAGYTYEAMEKAGGHREWFEKYWECARAKIQSVVNLLQPLDTQQCEIIATLYSAWADMLSAGRAVTDDAIITEVLTNWHESKQAIPHDRWSKALGWMREKALVPVCSE